MWICFYDIVEKFEARPDKDERGQVGAVHKKSRSEEKGDTKSHVKVQKVKALKEEG